MYTRASFSILEATSSSKVWIFSLISSGSVEPRDFSFSFSLDFSDSPFFSRSNSCWSDSLSLAQFDNRFSKIPRASGILFLLSSNSAKAKWSKRLFYRFRYRNRYRYCHCYFYCYCYCCCCCCCCYLARRGEAKNLFGRVSTPSLNILVASSGWPTSLR